MTLDENAIERIVRLLTETRANAGGRTVYSGRGRQAPSMRRMR
jgi:hypothetical protein